MRPITNSERIIQSPKYTQVKSLNAKTIKLDVIKYDKIVSK